MFIAEHRNDLKQRCVIMPVMLGQTYRAFRAAQVPEKEAAEAAAELAKYETRFQSIDNRLDRLERRMTLVQWTLGFNLAIFERYPHQADRMIILRQPQRRTESCRNGCGCNPRNEPPS
jgi:hypothetical protein